MLPQYALFALIPLKIIALYVATRGTIQGTIRPDRISLILWTIPALLSFTIAIMNGSSWSAVPLLFAGAGPLVILALTFISKHKPWTPRVIDYISAPFSIIAVVLWLSTDNPALAVGFAIIADTAAALPTIVKAWKVPETESIAFYILGGIGNAIGLLTLATWSFETAGFAIYLTTLGIIMMGVITHKKLLAKLRRVIH